MSIYFDNAATTAVCTKAADAAYKVMTETYGNPSSLHIMGLESEKIISSARKKAADFLGVNVNSIYFTSGGTESDNMALFGAAQCARKRKTLIISEAEHPAVLSAAQELEHRGFNVMKVRMTPEGSIDLNHLESLINTDVFLVSIMQVNNETGAIMPIEDAVRLVKEKAPEAFFHSDMVQALGKLSMADVDMASFSGHKVHAPKGIGLMYIKQGVHIPPSLYGGGQQQGLRPGTENVPSAAAFAAALEEININQTWKRIAEIKNKLEELIKERIGNVKINGSGVPHILNVSFKGTKSEVLLHALESDGIMVSSGSACSSNKPAPSHVLTAMGLKKEEIDSALRFSFSRFNTLEEAEICVKSLEKHVPVLRRMSRL